jgi:H+/Cl- antiporter ClcA
VSIPISFYLFDISGGGHDLIESLAALSRPIEMLAVLFAGKMLFTAFCYGSGTSGGIFFPLLACGALLGSIMGQTLHTAGIIAADEAVSFMILAMAAFFSAVVKSPITGAVLILEMSGGFDHLASLILVSLSAFVTSDAIASRPVYNVLLERILQNKTNRPLSLPKGGP